jgi:hypothetical protein
MNKHNLNEIITHCRRVHIFTCVIPQIQFFWTKFEHAHS